MTLPTPLILVLAFLALVGGCQETNGPEEEATPIAIGTEVGMQAPALAGTSVDSTAFEQPSPFGSATVLLFYGSADCGLCRVQLTDAQRNLGAYDSEDTEIIALTLDTPVRSRALVDASGLTFPLISVDTATFRAWGAVGEGSNTALPATYVIDEAGIIRFRHIGRNASDRTTDADVLTIVHRLSDP